MTAPTTFREWYERGYAVWPQLRNKQPAYDLLPRVDEIDPTTGEVTERPTWEVFQSELPTEQMVSGWDAALSGGKPINIAAATGVLTGIVVVDIDDIDIAEEFAAEIGEKAASWQVRTSRGVHFYFRHPGNGREIGNRRYDYGDRPRVLEIKGDGGCITLPGSVHADGTVYAFVGEPKGKVPPKLPQLLCNVIEQAEREDREADEAVREYARAAEVSERRLSAYAQAALDGECGAIRMAPFGTQEGTLNEAALKIGHLVGGDVISPGAAYQNLLAAALDMPNQMGREKWKLREIERKVARGIRQGAMEPRGIPESDRALPPRERTQSGNGAGGAPHHEGEPAAYPNGSARGDVGPDGDASPEQNTEPKKPQLRFRGDWKTAGARLDLVEGLIGHEMFGLIYGPSDAGKSFVAIDLACHVATGRSWHGHGTKQGLVIYIACEGPHSVEMRLEAWFQTYDPGNTTPTIATFTEPVNFGQATHDAGYIAELINYASKKLGMPAKLVFVDTASQALAGAKENDEGFGQLIQNCLKIGHATGATMIPVHHTPKDGETPRGHTSLPAAADLRLSVTRGEDQPVCAKVARQRDGTAEGAKMWFEFKSVEVSQADGSDPVESAVLVAGNQPDEAEKTKRDYLSPTLQNVIDRLKEHARRTHSWDVTADDFRQIAINSGAIDPEHTRATRQLHEMKQKLQKARIIRVEESGRMVRLLDPTLFGGG